MMGPLAVIGPGTLGKSMASWAALQGMEVRLAGRDLGHSCRAKQEIESGWARGLSKGRYSEDSIQAASSLLCASASWPEAVAGASTVFEALPEQPSEKIQGWRALAAQAPASALFLSGTSSLPIGGLDTAAELGNRLQGFHLFVPVGRMAVVELVTPNPVAETLKNRAFALASHLKLKAVSVRDIPGFAASRMALAQGLEAMRLLEEGVASAEGLDALMVEGYGHPMGPLALSDRIGLDLRLSIAESIFAASGDPRFEPPKILRTLVEQGHTGTKAGQGFYLWTDAGGSPCPS